MSEVIEVSQRIMKNIIMFLLFGHIHKWTTVSTQELTREGSNERGTRLILRCATCGNVKKVDLI